MKQELIREVVQKMLPYLNNSQSEKLQETLQSTLFNYEVTESSDAEKGDTPAFVELFLSAKHIEGCSEKSLKYYKATIQTMITELQKDVRQIVTDDVRGYLTEYQSRKLLMTNQNIQTGPLVTILRRISRLILLLFWINMDIHP